MSQEINPEVINPSDVEEIISAPEAVTPSEESVESAVEAEAPEEVHEVESPEAPVDYSTMSLAELVAAMQEIVASATRMQFSGKAEAIRSSFYRLLEKEKSIEAGDASALEEAKEGIARIEATFKELYAIYKKERSKFSKEIEAQREANLEAKRQVIEDLKALIDGGNSDSQSAIAAFREIQARWRSIGQVPASEFKGLNETYQLHVERFYDLLNINREMREHDFRKNLEEKTAFCEQAEKLAESDNPSAAFHALQKLHEAWKALGPVAKSEREAIWERFKAATARVNKNYQQYLDEQKVNFEANLAAKTALCEKVEEIVAVEISTSDEWAEYTRQIEEIQVEWKKIGFASKKENQKVYDRFRAACDAFFARKRDYYASYKDAMSENVAKKIALCERVEALKTSTEWKKTTEEIIALQKEWKEVGNVPRKKGELLWKRFRTACDEFFAERDKHTHENDYHANLKAKRAIIEKMNAYELSGDDAADRAAYEEFAAQWAEIGFVPFRDKEKITEAYRAASSRFPRASSSRSRGGREQRPLTEKEKLMRLYAQKEQELANYENNIGFFVRSKSSEGLLASLQDSIEKARQELKALEERIRSLEE